MGSPSIFVKVGGCVEVSSSMFRCANIIALIPKIKKKCCFIWINNSYCHISPYVSFMMSNNGRSDARVCMIHDFNHITILLSNLGLASIFYRYEIDSRVLTCQ